MSVESSTLESRYRKDERVIWIAPRNSNPYYRVEEKCLGSVFHVFDNGGRPTYQIKLDKVRDGRPIIVGNVMESCLDDPPA